MSESLTRLQTIAQLRDYVGASRSRGQTVALVPTMGALHQGHARLIEVGRQRAQESIVSIFVNPTQFAPDEDFARYPRTLEADVATAEKAGATAIFMPSAEEVYPKASLGTTVEVPRLSQILEGASRPTHFRGVTTVVSKLFHMAQPDLAVFGEKDYQQLVLIRTMVADLNIPVGIHAVPTIRDPDGVALSSRNRFLTPDQRRSARILNQALREGFELASQRWENPQTVQRRLQDRISEEPDVALDYALLVDPETLEPCPTGSWDRPLRALVAARVGSTRLIDNMALIPGGAE